MSDLLIKNMKLPRNCGCCDMCVLSNDKQTFFCIRLGKRFRWSLVEKRQEDCPLVEVKPHGRLIDENDLVRLIEDNYGCGVCKNKADEERCLDRCKWAVLLNDIDSLPTVLEESNGTDS